MAAPLPETSGEPRRAQCQPPSSATRTVATWPCGTLRERESEHGRKGGGRTLRRDAGATAAGPRREKRQAGERGQGRPRRRPGAVARAALPFFNKPAGARGGGALGRACSLRTTPRKGGRKKASAARPRQGGGQAEATSGGGAERLEPRRPRRERAHTGTHERAATRPGVGRGCASGTNGADCHPTPARVSHRPAVTSYKRPRRRKPDNEMLTRA